MRPNCRCDNMSACRLRLVQPVRLAPGLSHRCEELRAFLCLLHDGWWAGMSAGRKFGRNAPSSRHAITQNQKENCCERTTALDAGHVERSMIGFRAETELARRTGR